MLLRRKRGRGGSQNTNYGGHEQQAGATGRINERKCGQSWRFMRLVRLTFELQRGREAYQLYGREHFSQRPDGD
jgi:hypothetical protein